MEIKLSRKKMIAVANKAYSDGTLSLPSTYKQAKKGGNGDMLADFIVVELIEGADGDPDEAAWEMRNASEQLLKVAAAFAKF